MGWSILYGADAAFRVSAFLSKWIIPEKFYCALPYGVTDDKFIRSKRSEICDVKKTIFTFKNTSIKDGLPISFTFDANDYKRCRDIIKNRLFDEWYIKGESLLDNKKVNESRSYTLQQIFSGLDIDDANIIELPWFYNIMSWDGYREYLSSDYKLIKNNLYFPKTKRQIFIREKFTEKSKINNYYNNISERKYDDEQTETEANS